MAFSKAFAHNTLRSDKIPGTNHFVQDLNVWLRQVDAATHMFAWEPLAKFAIAPLIIDSVVWADILPQLPVQDPTWDHVVAALRALRGIPAGGLEYLRQLDAARQAPDESVQAFAARFGRLCMLAEQQPNQRRLQFKAALRPEIFAGLLSQAPAEFAGVRDAATVVEANLALVAAASGPPVAAAAVAEPDGSEGAFEAASFRPAPRRGTFARRGDRRGHGNGAGWQDSRPPPATPCPNCGGMGHWRTACPSPPGSARRGSRPAKSLVPLKGLQAASWSPPGTSSEPCDEWSCNPHMSVSAVASAGTVRTPSGFRVKVQLGRRSPRSVEALADSGADLSMIDERLLRQCGSHRIFQDPTVPAVRSLAGQLNVRGVAYVGLSVAGRAFKSVRLVVVRGLPDTHQCILGLDLLSSWGVRLECSTRIFSFDPVEPAVAAAARPVPPETARSTPRAGTGAFDALSPEKQELIRSIDFGARARQHEQEYLNTCAEFVSVFANDPDAHNLANEAYTGSCSFTIRDPTPWPARHFSTPFAYTSFIEEEVRNWLAWGVISTTVSDYNSPIFAVTRPGSDKLRLVVDFTQLNSRIMLDTYRPPTFHSLAAGLGGDDTFSTLDLQHAFLQLPLAEEVRQFTAFTWKGQQYQFNRVPFGLACAPLFLQRVVDKFTARLPAVKVYADDTLVHSGQDMHLTALRAYLEVLQRLNLAVKPSKCRMGHDKVLWLGRAISAGKVELAPADVEAVQAWPRPADRKQLLAFLGKLMWTQEFVPGIHQLIQPLRLLAKAKAWFWERDQERAFKEAKAALTLAIPLHAPNFNKPFVVEVDASRSGFGAFLLQGDRVVRVARKATTAGEAGLQATSLELAALVWAVDTFSHYLLGRHFQVITDHRSLQWLKSIRTPFARLALWRNALDQFDFEVKYRPGHLHGAADAMSRSQLLVAAVTTTAQKLTESDVMPSMAELVEAQRADPELARVRAKLEEGDENTARTHITDVDGALCTLVFRYNYPHLRYLVPALLQPRYVLLCREIYP